ncbi:unnamed protein product [Rhizoctonia solani]|uniref:Uncharacterized protein n=2 Tax=Rhizoctonia solani TaxID=456999 RepID=A0A8H3GEC4_9AGAM
MAPKRPSSVKPVAPRAKRSRRTLSEDEETSPPTPAPKASAAPKNPITPSSAPRTFSKQTKTTVSRHVDTNEGGRVTRASLKKTKISVPREDTDEGEGDGDDKSDDEDADGDDGDGDGDDEDEDEDTPAVSKGRKSKGRKPRAKSTVSEKDAFSRGFFRAVKPVINVYYNKESNLIRLRCAEYHAQASTAKAKIQNLEAKKQYLMALRENEINLTGASLERYRQTCSDNAKSGMLKLENEFKALEVSQAKYDSDILSMRILLEKRKDQVAETNTNVENTATLARLESIRNNMINGGVPSV